MSDELRRDVRVSVHTFNYLAIGEKFMLGFNAEVDDWYRQAWVGRGDDGGDRAGAGRLEECAGTRGSFRCRRGSVGAHCRGSVADRRVVDRGGGLPAEVADTGGEGLPDHR